MTVEDVRNALEGLCKGLRSDGADLVIDRATPDQVEMTLVVKDETCMKCIVDHQMLLSWIRVALKRANLQVPDILLHDPRSQ